MNTPKPNVKPHYLFTYRKLCRLIGFWTIVMVISNGCAMFNDEFKRKAPDQVVTTVRYPGILTISIVSATDTLYSERILNYLILQNAGDKTLTLTDVLVEVFSQDIHTYENRIRSERRLVTSVLMPDQTDTILLQSSADFIDHKSNIEICLLDVSGIDHHPLSGRYQGSFKTYKNNSIVFGGASVTTIDILGNLNVKLQSPNEFNVASGAVTPDSLVLSVLKKNEVDIRRVQTSMNKATGNGLHINFSIQNDFADSTSLTFQKSN